MVTILTVGSSAGRRRCDAGCYNAKGATCRCVCSGRNHGKGYERAIYEQGAALHGLFPDWEALGYHINVLAGQLALPEKEPT